MTYNSIPFNLNSGNKDFAGRDIFGGGNQQNPVNQMWASNMSSPPVLQQSALGGMPPPPAQGGMFDNFLTKGDQQGWGGMALGVGQGLANAYMGMKQYGLAKDTFNQNKLQFEKNLANQTKLTNSQLEDRQAARVASNPGGYQSVSDYMKKYGV